MFVLVHKHHTRLTWPFCLHSFLLHLKYHPMLGTSWTHLFSEREIPFTLGTLYQQQAQKMLVIVVKSTALLSWQLVAIKLQLLSSLNNGKAYFLPYLFKLSFYLKNIKNIIFFWFWGNQNWRWKGRYGPVFESVFWRNKLIDPMCIGIFH